ncbi:unnamed protein product [Didymodactylos carnosus]|uniref:F-box domain-containing protein n=1 Tax=Didymodactylos carnosus TaxID=1234261 RepID=A0A815GV24_9BILA|nr:unnamed protein product [Didymodactylos carnosus]CAF4207568.1 unnamed protein product [Didymodactylos carnosus]
MAESKLIDLPNEIFLEIFEYFDVSHVFYSLYGLIVRLDTLVKQCHPYHLNLDTAEKFNCVPEYLQPERIRSLTISSSDQMLLFNKLFSMVKVVENCQALIVHDIQPLDFIDLVPQLSNFKNLSSLSVIRKMPISYKHIYSILFRMIICNQIPALKYLKLIVPNRILFIPGPELIIPSNNLEHLVLNYCTIKDVFDLLHYMCNLNSLNIHSLHEGSICHLARKATIIDLKIKTKSDVTFKYLTVLLIEMPQLKTFSLKAFGEDFADGHKWKRLIESHFPFLTKFRFIIGINIVNLDAINQILSTFQTDFWSKTKKWFVKYDYRNVGDRDRGRRRGGDEGEGRRVFTRIYTIP